ncbi:DUF6254 family protein [Paenibacillus abyssi]|uniref:Uncharacterized protein n=1 Tax=Paenibacillus abyssi TaxID=1340531 RepID=A0A917CSP9_9BACL|nr:DUF6254 family protein [Paenibacillus abyssi]GGF98296.1 hypothetical protein GCM10010916_14430 [Paenibacillus abyssi]
MSTSKRREESAWKSRKQNQQPHGKVKSLHELSQEQEADQETSTSQRKD